MSRTVRVETEGYLLLRLAVEGADVFFVVKHSRFAERGETAEESREHMRFFVEEHTCPTNLVDIPAIIQDGNTDPHGVFEFVDWKPAPPGVDEDDIDWLLLFPQTAKGVTIDASAAVPRSLK